MSETITIKTNNIPRDLVAWFDMPANAAAWFDYVEDGDKFSYRFFEYRGEWYDVNEFECAGKLGTTVFAGWDGYQSESFFSGLVVRYADSNCESVVVGRYYS